MNVEIRCGRDCLVISLPDSTPVVGTKELDIPADSMSSVKSSLLEPIGRPPLIETARQRGNACIVVSDHSRPVPNKIIVPALLDTLHQAGMSESDIIILIATGMHPPMNRNAIVELLGDDIASRYRVINHDCHDSSRNIKIAEFESRPIEIDRLYLDADLKIVTGLIEPHHIAGYSGGGKSILPGVASFNSMKFMHSFAMLADPRVRIANISDNPFQEYVRRTAQASGTDFMINVLINKDRELSVVFSGDVIEAHSAGCRAAEERLVTWIEKPVDLVIASAAGLPLDATLYQACKGYIAAIDAVRPGGKILLIAGCENGIGGDDFRRMVDPAMTRKEFDEFYSMEDHFTVDQWAAQRHYQALDHFSEMYLFAPSLPPETITRLGMIPVIDLQKTVDQLLTEHPDALVIPEGPYVTVQVRSTTP